MVGDLINYILQVVGGLTISYGIVWCLVHIIYEVRKTIRQ